MADAVSLQDAIARAQAAAEAAQGDTSQGKALDAEVASQARLEAWERLWSLALPIDATDERLLVEDRLDGTLGASLPAVREWVRAGGARLPWLVLTGPTGRGKTLAAAWAMYASPLWAGVYVGARELERLHITRYGDVTVERYELLCRRAALVVVDDIGREDSAEKMGSALLDMVDGRRGSRHRTIACTNLTRDAMRKRYPDKRLWSRLDSCARFVVDAGPDLRVPLGTG